MKKRFLRGLKCIGCSLLLASVLFCLYKAHEYLTVYSLLNRYALSDKASVTTVLKVGKHKTYPTLQSAVDAAENGGVIVVFAGKYQQSVHASDKTLYIVGQSRNNCVLTNPNGNYFYPPIELGSGMLANLTVHATDTPKAADAVAKAYALHTDFNVSANSSLDVMDVDFINDSYQTVGIGLRSNFTLRFQNCLFQCNTNSNAFYCHDDPTAENSTGQHLIVENCHFINSGETASTILLQSQEASGSEILCLWKHNTVTNTAGNQYFSVLLWTEKTSSLAGWQNMSYWKNSPGSLGNNLTELNDP